MVSEREISHKLSWVMTCICDECVAVAAIPLENLGRKLQSTHGPSPSGNTVSNMLGGTRLERNDILASMTQSATAVSNDSMKH